MGKALRKTSILSNGLGRRAQGSRVQASRWYDPRVQDARWVV